MSEQSERVIDLLEGAAEEGGVGMLNVVNMMLIIVIKPKFCILTKLGSGCHNNNNNNNNNK